MVKLTNRQRLGRLLKTGRTTNTDLTQDQVAKRLKVSGFMVVSNWERGVWLPAAPNMEKLIRLYRLDPDTAWPLWIKAKAEPAPATKKKAASPPDGAEAAPPAAPARHPADVLATETADRARPAPRRAPRTGA